MGPTCFFYFFFYFIPNGSMGGVWGAFLQNGATVGPFLLPCLTKDLD